MTNEEQMQVLKEAIKSNYKGSLAEILQPQQQPQGPEGVAMQQQMPEMPVPPASPPRINPASAQPPVQDNQGHLVQSYQSAPPGLRNLPSGPAEGMLIQKMEKGGTKDPNPKEYSIENIEQPTGKDEEAVVSKRTFDAFKNLDVVKDSFNVDRFLDFSNADPKDYVEYDGKLVSRSLLESILADDYGDSTIDGEPLKEYKLRRLMDYRNLDQEEYVGKDVISGYEDFKDKQNTDYRYEGGRQDSNAPIFKAMDKVLPALDKLTDAEVQEFTRLINTLSSPYTEAMSENEDFGVTDALRILANQDISGIKKYREKMGLTKSDILDLIQPPEDANKFVKGLTSLTKKALKFKPFEDGGPRRTDGPRAIPSKESNEGMTGMMKAKIAMENEFGNNPAISRMIKPTDKSYDFGDGRTGTHHMGSYGKSAIPNIQDVGGSLQYTGPRTDEAIKFNREQDARYFAEKYKDVAPALRKRKSGGYKPKYPQKFQEGGYNESGVFIPQGGYNTNDQGLVTHSGDRYAFYGDQRKDDYLNKQLATGKFGFNPQTGAMVRLKPNKQVEVSAKDQTIIDRGQQLVKDQEKTFVDSQGNKIALDDQYGIDFNKKSSEHQMFDLGYTGLSVKPQYQRLADDYISGKNKTDLARDAYIRIGQHKGNEAFGMVAGSLIPIGNAPRIAKYAPKIVKPLIAPMQKYGASVADDIVKLTSKSPANQSLMQTVKSKTGNVLSATYNTMKGMAVPQAYSILANQAQNEIKGEGTMDNRLQAIKKATDVIPQLSKIKDTFKISKDLYDKDYDSAALRTVALLGKKNPLVKYGTKLINKFTNTDLVKSAPEAAESVKGKVIEGISTLKQAVLPEYKQIAGNRYGGYRKKLRKKKRK